MIPTRSTFKRTERKNKRYNNISYHTCHIKHKHFLEYAALYALKSPLKWKYAAIIVKKNKIISIGYNHYTLTPFSGLYSTHAEIDALNNCKNKKDLSGAVMYVVHVNMNLLNNPSTYLSAAPCFDCEVKLCKCMKKFGLTTVYYSTEMIIN